MDKKNVTFFPIIGSIQKINLYETKSRLYLVGSNNVETRFRVLQIDRIEAKDLVIYDDKVEYSKDEIHDLVNRIEAGNRQTKTVSAFGIVGFVRFLEGYYIILITKRRKIAVVGYHTIYKIQHTSMIYIPNDTIRVLHPDEPRYLKMFQGIDLSSNFYFSYSYDITHTLQFNLTYPKEIVPNVATPASIDPKHILAAPSIVPQHNARGASQRFGVRTNPQRRFVWNTHLLRPVENLLHPDWILYVTHGFIDQANVDVFGKSIYIVLISRRSCQYAGTRFLKRGANFRGDVANEVETEQIVYDTGVSAMRQGHFTSFVQMRGSVPGHWSQDQAKMVAKPPITVDINEPYYETAAAHFNDLLKRYGAPIIILNLVKQREKRAHERLLTNELIHAVKYLNQFLAPEHHIVYRSFDMARENKGRADVMAKLADKSRNAVMKTGIFHNRAQYYAQNPATVIGQHRDPNANCSLQTGIVRTNCVDCLDRTNTAQFAIGKCVLGYQLCALGVLDSPKLEFDTDCVRMLENLYEDLGDTLALQYGGSFLVHRIRTYRKTAPWTSQGNDIMQTLSRYYNNTFSDAEKQNTMNLFLGLFVPRENRAPIWDYTNDYYLHHIWKVEERRRPLSQWWDEEVHQCLPYASNELTKTCSELIQVESDDVEMIDGFTDFYRPDALTILADMFAYTISNSIRDFMPNFTTNYSPFAIRVRPGRRREESSNKIGNVKNPSLTGQSSTSSTASSDSSCSEMESSNEESSIQINDSPLTASRECSPKMTFERLFPSMKETYGVEVKQPPRNDLLLYKKYVFLGKKANGTLKRDSGLLPVLKPLSCFSSDTSERVAPPSVTESARNAYAAYVNVRVNGASTPTAPNILIYRKYVQVK